MEEEDKEEKHEKEEKVDSLHTPLIWYWRIKHLRSFSKAVV